MKLLILGRWNLIVDNRYNPIRRLDMASQQYFVRILAWMWSLIFTLSFFSIFQFQFTWVAVLFVIAGVFTSLSLFKHAQSCSAKKAPVQNLGHASVCLWQLDREA